MNSYPIENLTEKEQKVFSAITLTCFDEYCCDLSDIKAHTGFEFETIKGVVGSLVKKGHVCTEEENRGGKLFHDINPLFSGETLSFGNESGSLSDEDMEMAERVASLLINQGE